MVTSKHISFNLPWKFSSLSLSLSFFFLFFIFEIEFYYEICRFSLSTLLSNGSHRIEIFTETCLKAIFFISISWISFLWFSYDDREYFFCVSVVGLFYLCLNDENNTTIIHETCSVNWKINKHFFIFFFYFVFEVIDLPLSCSFLNFPPQKSSHLVYYSIELEKEAEGRGYNIGY
jgi:hypothetical protein